MAKILKNDNPQKLNLRTRSMHFVRNTSENWCLPEFNNAILAIHIKCRYNGSWGKKKRKKEIMAIFLLHLLCVCSYLNALSYR